MSRPGIPYQLFGVVSLLSGYGPLVVASSGVFLGVWSSEQGWSRSSVSFAIGISMLSFATGHLLVGMAVERFGERRVVVSSLSGIALVLLLTSLVQNVYQLCLAYSVLGFVGAGTSGLPYLRAIYVRGGDSVGLTSAVLIASGAGGGFFIWPLAVAWGAGSFGWRITVLAMSVFILTVSLPACWRFFSLAKKFDSLRGHTAGRSEDATWPAVQDRKAGATRAASYAVFIAFCSMFFFGVQGIVVHFVPIAIDSGLSLKQAGATASLLGLALIPILIFSGWLGDRYRPGTIACLLGLAAAFGAALLSNGLFMPDFAWVAMCALAAGFGVEILIPLMVKNQYGSASFARRYAVVFSFYMFGRAIGPWTLGIWWDSTGSYSGIVMLYAVLIGLGAAYFALNSSLCMPSVGREGAQRRPWERA